MSNFKQLAINALLQDLFTDSYFSICKVRALAKHLGQDDTDPKFSLIAEFHCVSWKKMPAGFSDELKNETLLILGFTQDNLINP